jgi:hypothetical protein
MAQRRVATLLNCREWTTIIEALNTHGLIVALSMHLSNLASRQQYSLLPKACGPVNGEREFVTQTSLGVRPLADLTCEAVHRGAGLYTAQGVSRGKRGWHACT